MIEAIIISLGIIIALLGVVEIIVGIYIIKSANKRFIVKTNKEGETTIESVGKPKQKMEFLEEIDRKQVEDIERPGALQSFLGQFKKPAKKEEEEEEV